MEYFLFRNHKLPTLGNIPLLNQRVESSMKGMDECILCNGIEWNIFALLEFRHLTYSWYKDYLYRG